jgi:hypothetical protein
MDDLQKLQTFAESIINTKNKANTFFIAQQYHQAEIEYQTVMDTYGSFKDNFQSSHDQDFSAPNLKENSPQGQGGMKSLASQTNMFEIYEESHLNLAIC